jgi:hypothetical protein
MKYVYLGVLPGCMELRKAHLDSFADKTVDTCTPIQEKNE